MSRRIDVFNAISNPLPLRDYSWDQGDLTKGAEGECFGKPMFQDEFKAPRRALDSL